MRVGRLISLVLISIDLLLSQNLQIGGYVQTDDRIRLKDKTISWQEYRLDLTGRVELDKVKFYSEIWVRNFGAGRPSSLYELVDKSKVEVVNIDVREAYADVKGFIFDNLDLKIGRQRIAWGTADKLNPTDNLDPDDLEDIWDFGRHLGSNAVKLSYYLGDFTFTGVFIPTFTPAVLPRGDWMNVFLSEFLSDLPAIGRYLYIFPESGNYAIKVLSPEQTLKDASKFGFKISKRNILGFDASLSYVVGRDDIPILQSYIVSYADTIVLFFPRMRTLGFDFSGDIGGVGLWGEAGIFFPEEVNASISVLWNGRIIYDTIKVLEAKNYTRFVLGVDYTFGNGLYVNLQYLHGFLHERGRGNLKNYFVFNFEKKYMNDRLKLNFLSGGVEFKRIDDLRKRNNYALIYNPQISYSPVDNFEIIFGARIIDGRGKTMFGGMRDRDEIYLSAKYNF